MDTFVANKGVWGTFWVWGISLHTVFANNLHNQLQLNIVSVFF